MSNNLKKQPLQQKNQVKKNKKDLSSIVDENDEECEASSQEMVISQDDDLKHINQNIQNFNEESIKNNFNKLKLDLILEIEEKTNKKYKELINQYDISDFIDNKKQIKLSELLSDIKTQGYPFEGNMISYYSQDAEMYVYCGYDPLPDDIFIPKEDYFDQQKLIIKCKENPISLIHQIMCEDANENSKGKSNQQQEKENNNGANNKCRRTKERKIGFIIEKVVLWRQYYNGIPDEYNKITRLSLEESAHQVQISKKSLDDYLLQIRFGRKYGFNFNEHKNDKVGVLRAFVKKHKNQQTDKPKKKNKDKGKASDIASSGSQKNQL